MPPLLLGLTTRRLTCPQGFVPLFKGSNRDFLRQPHFTGEGVMLPPVEFVGVANNCFGTINHLVTVAFCRHLRAHGPHCHEEQRNGSMSHCNEAPAPIFIRST